MFSFPLLSIHCTRFLVHTSVFEGRGSQTWEDTRNHLFSLYRTGTWNVQGAQIIWSVILRKWSSSLLGSVSPHYLPTLYSSVKITLKLSTQPNCSAVRQACPGSLCTCAWTQTFPPNFAFKKNSLFQMPVRFHTELVILPSLNKSNQK